MCVTTSANALTITEGVSAVGWAGTKSPQFWHRGDFVLVNRAYALTFQTDGNLVMYNGVDPVWSTNTGGRGCSLRGQTDGNLVIYGCHNEALWNSRVFLYSGQYMEARLSPGGWCVNDMVNGYTLQSKCYYG